MRDLSCPSTFLGVSRQVQLSDELRVLDHSDVDGCGCACTVDLFVRHCRSCK